MTKIADERLALAAALEEFAMIDEAEGGNTQVIATERRAAELLRAQGGFWVEFSPELEKIIAALPPTTSGKAHLTLRRGPLEASPVPVSEAVTDEMRKRGKEALQVLNRRKMTCAEMANVVLDAALAAKGGQ